MGFYTHRMTHSHPMSVVMSETIYSNRTVFPLGNFTE
jgi:hypothetical protein